MRSTKHSDPVELVSIGADGLTIDDLLTEKISPELRWLNQGVSIGDAGIHPAESLLETFAKLDLPDYFLDYDLSSIKEDGLENLYLVGGDGDGHEYVVGVRSHQFYAMWHDETAFELVAGSTNEFLQWVIRERSDHLQGCPWEVFLTGLQPVKLKDLWHKDDVDPDPLIERAREVASWSREFVSPLGFELFSDKEEIDIRFKKEHRGHKSHFFLHWVGESLQIQEFLEWLKNRGFDRKWH